MGTLILFKPVQKEENEAKHEDSYNFLKIMEENRKKQQKEAEDRAKANQKVKKDYKLTK